MILVLIRLINHFGAIYELTDDFVIFEDSYNGTPIEVIAMRGEDGPTQSGRDVLLAHTSCRLSREYEVRKVAARSLKARILLVKEI